jgi:small subunit ribosomal protein S9
MIEKDSQERGATDSTRDPKPEMSVLDKKGRVYATGKRKTAVARVWIKPNGVGKFIVNGRAGKEFFPGLRLANTLNRPFDAVGRAGAYDVMCTTAGGGVSAQAQAVCHGISKALQSYEPELRSTLKSLGLLTRDARRVERKKPGLRKARRKPQFSKR